MYFCCFFQGTLFFKDKKINIGPAVKKDGPMIQPEVVIGKLSYEVILHSCRGTSCSQP